MHLWRSRVSELDHEKSLLLLTLDLTLDLDLARVRVCTKGQFANNCGLSPEKSIHQARTLAWSFPLPSPTSLIDGGELRTTRVAKINLVRLHHRHRDEQWLSMRSETAPVRVVQSNSVVEWNAMTGVEIRLQLEVGASFGSCVARPKKGRNIWDSGSARNVFGPVKNMFRERVEQCGERERGNRLLCCHRNCSGQGRPEKRQGQETSR